MKTSKRTSIAMICCACVLLGLAITEAFDGGAFVKWLAFDAIPFLAFWLSVGLVISLAGKLLAWIAGIEAKEASERIALSLFVLFIALTVVLLYSNYVILPAIAMPGVEQTGVGSVWVIASVITAMVALPTAAGFAELL